MRGGTMVALAAAMAVVCARAEAAPIDYSYSGAVSVAVNGMNYSGTGAITGHGNTDDAYGPIDRRFNTLSSLQISIPGVFQTTVSGPTYAFSAAEAFGFALGSAFGTNFAVSFPLGGDLYSLTTNLGPTNLLNGQTRISGNVQTDAGLVAVTVNSASFSALVPEPISVSLLMAPLFAIAALRRRR